MDRIELVEKMQERLGEVEAKRDKLKVDRDDAYNRSYEYFHKKFEACADTEPKSVQLMYVNDCTAILTKWDIEAKFGKDTVYSFEAVLDLGHSIRSVEKECEDLESEISKYKNQDMVGYINKLNKD